MSRKPYSCSINEDIIKSIREVSSSRGISQGDLIAEAITNHLERNEESMKPSLDSNEGFIIEQFKALKEELYQKNQQINTLMESQIQANHIIARFQQNQLLIESNQNSEQETTEPEIIQPTDQKGKKKESKGKRSKKGKKKLRKS